MSIFTELRGFYHRAHAQERFYQQLAVGLGLLLVSLAADLAANIYILSQRGSGIVSDLLLDRLPILRLDDIYLEGFAAFLVLTLLIGLHRPQRLPFMLKAISLFYFVRSFFMILTHLSMPLSSAQFLSYTSNDGLMRFFSSGNDLFFSGHTGLPFLLALLFWKEKPLRYIFLTASVIFGLAMLLAHVHYSIDVFGAFFITYAIYDLAVWLFTKDHAFFHVS